MSTELVLTDIGREYFARFLARYDDWAANGYELFSYHSWGEGAFQEVSGVDVPIPPSNFTGNTDLEIIRNPGSYDTINDTDFASAYYAIDLNTEVEYLSTEETFRVLSRLEDAEGNNSPTDPRYFEIGLYDNAGDLAGQSPFSSDPEFSKGNSDVRGDGTGGTTGEHHMVAFGTFNARFKDSSLTLEIEHDFPLDP